MISVNVRGTPVLIDEVDFHLFINREWHVTTNGYVRSKGQFLHRLVMQAVHGQVVDHINGNPMDNRRENLRVCTQAQNIRNRNKLRKAKTSKFKGVSWDKRRGLWLARIGTGNGKLKNLGRFKTEEAAARAYNESALIIDPRFYNLNKGIG